MNNLQLITTESFGDLSCNFYRNMNNDILLTREQIGTALEYANPQKAIQKIHLKHKERLDDLCTRIVEHRVPQSGGVGINVETVYYTQRGTMEICRWSKQPKANLFMDWVWNIIEKYQNGQLQSQQTMSYLVENLNQLTNTITTAFSSLNERVSAMEDKLQESSQLPHKQIYNPWFSKMNNKYQLLQDYFNITRGQLYRNILLELENLYDLNTTQIQADYLYENNLTSCYPLDPYSFVPKYRDMIEQIVNTNLVKYKIASEDDPITSTKHITIFDTPVDLITH